MNRRQFLKKLTLTTLGLNLSVPISGSEPLTSSKKKYNVLFIAVDDLRDWVGHLKGHPNAKTPNIDRLARRGVSFTRAYCSAPLCNPSRVSLLTGIAPYRSGIYGNGEKLRTKLPDSITLMQHFRASGYSVQGGGKIFHGKFAYDADSWDFYFKPSESVKKIQKKKSPGSGWRPWGPLDCSDEDMFDGKVARWAASELKKPQEKSFFLACGTTKPHLAWKVPQKYFNMHPLDKIKLPPVTEGDLNDVPPYAQHLARGVIDPSTDKNFARPGGDHSDILANNNWYKAVQACLAAISFADAQIGLLLDALDQSEHKDNTVIILWGDHGWHLGEKEHWRKHALWDVSTRTPLIISAPAGVVKGQLCHRPVSLIDIYPTLVDLCGLPERTGLDGQSLKPLLGNPKQKWNRPVVMTHGYKNHAIQTERWRYIQYKDGTNELYDHNSDPNEWNNLAENPEHKKVIQELQKALPKINAEHIKNAEYIKSVKKKRTKKNK